MRLLFESGTIVCSSLFFYGSAESENGTVEYMAGVRVRNHNTKSVYIYTEVDMAWPLLHRDKGIGGGGVLHNTKRVAML